MSTPARTTLKVIVVVHFILSLWAGQIFGFLPSSYLYMNWFILMIGVWAIAVPDSTEPVFMFLGLHLFSIIQDIIFLGIYQPRANLYFEESNSLGRSGRDEYRFCLGMCILNLLIKPVTAFLLFRIYQERGGESGSLNFSGVRNFPAFGTQHGTYENIDQPVPPNQVETASAPQYEKPPIQP
ncbi:hypothetical protein ScPMuIL_007479 [Solemya velum]